MKTLINKIFSHAKKYKFIYIILTIIFLFIMMNVISSLSRVGFNMNVVYNQNKPENQYYLKLSEIAEKTPKTYNIWSGDISTSLSGSGTKENPYLINNGGDLLYINHLLSQIFYLKEGSKNINDCLRPYLNYEETLNTEFLDGLYKTSYTLKLTNESSTTLTNIIAKFQIDEMSIDKVLIDDEEIPHTIDDNYLLIDQDISLLENTFLTIKMISTNEIKMENIDLIEYTGYDDEYLDYYGSHICKNAYYDTTNMYYKVTNNIDFDNIEFPGIGYDYNTFKGIIDGNNKVFKNIKITETTESLSNGIFKYIENATIKSIIIDNSNLEIQNDSPNYSGLLIGYAAGNSKIYNIGINNSNIEIKRNSEEEMYVGSIVGYIKDKTIVTNSYSYANITANGKNNTNMIVGGLVGYRTGTNTKMNDDNPKVYLLVMYGSMNISSSKSTQYVYNGAKFNSSENPTYCYYLWQGETNDTSKTTLDTYAILKSYDDIVADGFKAHLNNYRYMVDYYLGNSQTPRENEQEGYQDIAYWYTLNNESLYPILKKYESNNSNYDLNDVSNTKISNSIKVNLVDPTNNNQKKVYYIKITEKDENINDFTNKKIILPFNAKTANFKYNGTGKKGNYTMTLSGWKLTKVVQNGNEITTPTDGNKFNYNYVLRSGDYSASKDINTIYAEGGFYLVPDNVTEITLEAYYAYTIYAKDAEYDKIYNLNYSNQDSSQFGLTNSSDTFNGLTPQTAVSTLSMAYNKAKEIPSSQRSTIYDVIIMLCGNLHYNPNRTVNNGAYVTSSSWAYTQNDVPLTIMSMDNDGDLEPDYALYTRNVHDEDLPSLRLNFVNFLGIPQVGTINAKLNALTMLDNAYLEVTETSKTDRIDLRHYRAKYIKLNAGYYNVYNLWNAESTSLNKKYLYFGGYAQAIYFTSGVESRALPSTSNNDVPTFVISGGRIDTLSSTYFNAVIGVANNLYFFIDGGYINNFYTTYNASVQKNANIDINNAYINTYYAGGHTESSIVAGGVKTTVKNSRIDSLYGGPEYGSIKKGSVINVENTEIDNFYGSGYGGTQTTEINLVYQDAGDALCSSYDYYYNISNSCSLPNSTTMSDSNKSYCFGRVDQSYGIETRFYATTYSKAGCASKAFAVYYSSLSAANVDYVTINLKDSIINKDFYGGGNKGIVDNSIVINMENTTIEGNLYGGGRSNEKETLEVYEDTAGYEDPKFISYNVDTEAVYPKKYEYTWSGDKTKFTNNSYINKEEKLIYSENDGKLGNVLGNIYVNVKNSHIKGNIYGGGNLSEVKGNIYINLEENNLLVGNVYGGGNKANVIGNIDIRVDKQKINELYGGGNLGDVIGDSTITISNGSILKNIYGGGNEADVTNTHLYLTNGTVTNVFGGSNSNGTVDKSNVYVGKINETEKQDGSKIEKNKIEEDSSYLPDLDTCLSRDITYNYSYSSGYFNFDITNNTDFDFTKWQAVITFENTQASTNNWSGHKSSWKGDTELTVNYQGQWYGPNTTTLNANTTTKIFNNTYPISLTSGSNIIVKSIVITAEDATGQTYTNEICHDKVIIPEEPLIPSDPIEKTIDIIVENVYGGNNFGGLCKDTNIVVDKATVTNLYGGGNLVNSNNTHITLNKYSLILENVYGGGNEAQVTENTFVELNSTTINGSAYAGGNGLGASVLGNTNLVSLGTTLVKENVFGGGNKAETGTSSNSKSISTVIINGGTIEKNVYGGANTSKIYGNTKVQIGVYKGYPKTDILINGTVFGGGEANASGSETYDYSYISVTNGIDIEIDSLNTDITINGSIFGSGNASSTSGYSNIHIANFGEKDNPKKIVSIQRCSNLLIKNSSINISGATDRTNEYNSIVYSLSRIDELSLANNSNLYIQSGTNVVKKLNSYYIDENNEYIKANVNINESKVTKNTDNRLYMVINKAFNIIDSENLATGTFGEVNGMIFLGLFELDRELKPSTGIYSSKYTTGSSVTIDEVFQFMSGSYVMGQHKTNHDYTIDGFYTNYVNNQKIETSIIEPTPENAKYYQWIVGESSTTFEIGLTASKFATMGTTSLPLLGFNEKNTYFELVSYNDNNLNKEVSLIDSDAVPRVAKTKEDALNNFGLKMSNSNANWLTDGNTHFISTPSTSSIMGTTKYMSNNTNEIPVLDFIFVHSKNITEDKKLGSVLVGMLAYQPIDEVTYKIERIYINISLDTKYFETDNYESSMTPGKEYELFVNSKTNITSKSSLSAYFSLFVEKEESIYKEGFYRVLISNYKLPENTRITMIDRTVSSKPEYYYYDVLAKDVDVEIVPNSKGIETTFYIYPLSDFIRVGSISSNNNYNDALANKNYYNDELKVNEEEFIFIVDYSEANINENLADAELLLELKDEDEYTRYDSLGVSHANMVYNVHTQSDSLIEVTATADKEKAYHGYDFNINAILDFSEIEKYEVTIKDTNYTQDKMGLKLTIYNSDNKRINGASLIGTIFNINGKSYYADLDGSIRANISDLVSDVAIKINVNLEKSLLKTDYYRIQIEAFGSSDGLYYGLTSAGSTSLNINIINENYGLLSTTGNENIIIDSNTGYNSNKNNELTYHIEYSSQFSNPNIRIKLYRRKYDNTYSLDYEEVDLKDYVSDELELKDNNQYLMTNEPLENNALTIHLKEKLVTGTYKLSFELYDNDNYIDAVYTYMIIK